MPYTEILMLQLFAEGEGAASSGEANSATAAAGQSENGTKSKAPRIEYGLQPEGVSKGSSGTEADTGADDNGADTQAAPSEEERRRAYREFIKNNKDLYTEDTQKMINRRFKETKELKGTVDKQNEVLDFLYAKYGVDDIDSLKSRVENDNEFIRGSDDEFGITDEEANGNFRMKVENVRMRRQIAESAEAERARRFNARIASEEAEMQKTVPGFSVRSEIERDPNFARLLQSNVSVKDAYMALHHDEIIQSALKFAQADTVKKTAENIRARGNRPRENGAGASSGVIVKSSASTLNKRDREEIARRVLAGENIVF